VWSYGGGKTDAIDVSVDKDIVLHGVCLLGRENATYSVELDVIDSRSKSSAASKTGEFFSELLQGNNYSYYGYRVSFDKKNYFKESHQLRHKG